MTLLIIPALISSTGYTQDIVTDLDQCEAEKEIVTGLCNKIVGECDKIITEQDLQIINLEKKANILQDYNKKLEDALKAEIDDPKYWYEKPETAGIIGFILGVLVISEGTGK